MRDANVTVMGSTDEVTESIRTQADVLEDFSNDLPKFEDAWVDAWASMANETRTLKETMLGLIASLLRALAKYLAGMAVLFSISLQWGKAAAALAGSIAAAIAAGVVQNLQQGGMVGGGYGGGDRVPIMAEPGEMVMRKEVVRTNRSALEAMNAGEQGMSVINVYLGTHKIHSEIAKAIRNGQIPLYKGALVSR